MRKMDCFVAVAALMFSIAGLAQEKRGPSTPEERQKAVAAIDDLEARPLGDTAQQEREWLTMWLIEVPDIHVSVCMLLPDMPKGNKKDSNIIFTQMLFSSARLAIQHKDEPADQPVQFQAGVRGALQVYEILLAARPKDRQPALDDLLKKRDDGTLDAYVKDKVATTCQASH